MINYLLRLFGFEIIKSKDIKELKDTVSDKSNKINEYFYKLKDIELEYNLLLQHFKEIKSDLDIFEKNMEYMDNITISLDNIKDLLTESNIRILSKLVLDIQNKIIKESTRSNLNEQDISYRAGAIDCTNSIISKLYDIKKSIDEPKKTNEVDGWSE